jgi:hypothetical protein
MAMSEAPHRWIDVRRTFSGFSAEVAILLPRGRDLRTFTAMTVHLRGSAVMTFAVIGPVVQLKS